MNVQDVTALKSPADLNLQVSNSRIVAFDQDTKELEALPVADLKNYHGLLNVNDSGNPSKLQSIVSKDKEQLHIWTCTNGADQSGGYVRVCTDLATVLHPNDSRGVAVNLGDLLVAWADDTQTYGIRAHIIPLSEAKKPADASDIGTYGLMVPNDKEKLDKCVTDIDENCFRCYQGEYNMNYRGWYGYHMYGTLGRPAGSVTGENYVLRVANGGKDGDYLILEQTAYSCLYPERVFRRIVKTKDRSNMQTAGNTIWGDWVQLPTAAQITNLQDQITALQTTIANLQSQIAAL